MLTNRFAECLLLDSVYGLRNKNPSPIHQICVFILAIAVIEIVVKLYLSNKLLVCRVMLQHKSIKIKRFNAVNHLQKNFQFSEIHINFVAQNRRWSSIYLKRPSLTTVGIWVRTSHNVSLNIQKIIQYTFVQFGCVSFESNRELVVENLVEGLKKRNVLFQQRSACIYRVTLRIVQTMYVHIKLAIVRLTNKSKLTLYQR